MLKWQPHSHKCTNLWLFIDHVSSTGNYREKRISNNLSTCPFSSSHSHQNVLCLYQKLLLLILLHISRDSWLLFIYPTKTSGSGMWNTNLELILTPHLRPVFAVVTKSWSWCWISFRLWDHQAGCGSHVSQKYLLQYKQPLPANISLRPVHLQQFSDILSAKF